MNDSLKICVDEFPTESGVYLMKDAKLKIIYVGKAKNLRSRVRQYLNASDKRYQISFLMSRVTQIDYIITQSEKDALLLENSLIKKHKPRYNVFLKDDKTYIGLRLSIQDEYPRLTETRRIKNDGALYYGPFVNVEAVREVKDFIYRFFMLRTCADHEFQNRSRPCLEYQIKRCSAPCVQIVSRIDYQKQIEQVRLFLEGKSQTLQSAVEKQMLQAAETENFEEAARLRDLLAHMQTVLTKQHVMRLSFDFVDVIATMHIDQQILIAVLMVREATLIDSKFFAFDSLEEPEVALQNFITQYYSERSFIPREIITEQLPADAELLNQLLTERSGRKISIHKASRGAKLKLVELAQKNLRSHLDRKQKQNQNTEVLLSQLQIKLDLPRPPRRIECYDISNISGKFAVGSMVTFLDGQKAPNEYKKFKIKTIDSPNDYAMLFEVLSRRLQNASWPKPDLLLMDGGRGQLQQAQKILQDLHIDDVPVIAISKGQGQGARAKGIYDNKKQDEIYVPGRKNPILLNGRAPELMVLQNLRDEAHRFAIAYHRQLRDKNLTTSWLDQVPGLGPQKKRALLKAFSSPQAIAEASFEELFAVPGINANLAKVIRDFTMTQNH